MTGGTPVGFNVGTPDGEAGSTLAGIDLVGGAGGGDRRRPGTLIHELASFGV